MNIENNQPAPNALVRRYHKTTDEPDEYTYDIVYTDRTTGREVMRYDGADPANGVTTDEDVFADKGRDINELVRVDQCVTKVTEYDVRAALSYEQRKLEREQAFERGSALLGDQCLLRWLGIEYFSFEDYYAEEQAKVKPALESKGYSNIAFVDGERDSFGPLSRVVVFRDAANQAYRVCYG